MSRSQKRAMETASVSHDEEHQHAVISFADAAKVRRKSEVTKEKRYKKELPPFRRQLILYQSTPSISTAMARSWTPFL